MARIDTKAREIVLAEYSNAVIITDYVLRWLLLGLYRVLYGNEGGHLLFFFTFQVLITIFTIAYALYRDYRYRKSIDADAKKDETTDEIVSYVMKGFSDSPYETLASSLSVALRIVLLISFCFMMVQVTQNIQTFDLKTLMSYRDKPSGIGITFTLTVFIYGVFLLLISAISVKGVSDEKIQVNLSRNTRHKPQTVEQMIEEQAAEDPSQPPSESQRGGISSETIVDANDIAIVEMEGDIRNLQNRVEAYILESVMLGALSFSGFLTLLSADERRVDYEIMTVFGDSIKKILIDIVLLKFDINDTAYQIFIDAGDDRRFLVAWIMFVTLMSSLFFVLVIISRLKFSSIIEKVDNAIRLARAYNDKEEEVFMLHLQFEDRDRLKKRLDLLGRKIAQQIAMATDLLKEVKPIVYYMSIFRNLGVFFCMLIIVIGVLFYSQLLAFLVGLLIFIVYIYKQVDDWYRRNRLKRIIQRNHEVQYLENR